MFTVVNVQALDVHICEQILITGQLNEQITGSTTASDSG